MEIEKSFRTTPLRWNDFGKWGLFRIMKSLLLSLIIILPLTVFGQGVSGTGWILEGEYSSKHIILFERDGTFTYLDISFPDLFGDKVNIENNNNNIYSIEDDDRITISFNGGFLICSLEINSSQDKMYGRCVNQNSIKKGTGTWETVGKKIE